MKALYILQLFALVASGFATGLWSTMIYDESGRTAYNLWRFFLCLMFAIISFIMLINK